MKAKKWLGEGIVNQKGTKHEALKNSQPIHIGEKKIGKHILKRTSRVWMDYNFIVYGMIWAGTFPVGTEGEMIGQNERRLSDSFSSFSGWWSYLAANVHCSLRGKNVLRVNLEIIRPTVLVSTGRWPLPKTWGQDCPVELQSMWHYSAQLGCGGRTSTQVVPEGRALNQSFDIWWTSPC